MPSLHFLSLLLLVAGGAAQTAAWKTVEVGTTDGTINTLNGCKAGAVVNCIKVQYEPYQGTGDDAGLDGIDGKCTDLSSFQWDGKLPNSVWGNYQCCPNGAYVMGLQSQYEPPAWGTLTDEIGMGGLRMKCKNPVTAATTTVTLRTETNSDFIMEWRDMVECSDGYWVTNIRVRHDAEGWLTDHLGLNSMWMECTPKAFVPPPPPWIIPPSGPSTTDVESRGEGAWTTLAGCTGDGLVDGVMVQNQPAATDETALNGIKASCHANGVPSGTFDYTGQQGTWATDYTKCPTNTWACGAQSQYDTTGSTDTKGMTGLRIFCCDVWGKVIITETVWSGSGTWATAHYCDNAEYITNLRVKYDTNSWFSDDQGMSGLQIICARPQTFAPLASSVPPPDTLKTAEPWQSCPQCVCDPAGPAGHNEVHPWLPAPDDWTSPVSDHMVVVEYGNYGTWQTKMECDSPNAVVRGIKVRYDEGSGIGDDTALNGISLECSDGTVKTFEGNEGTWQATFTECPPNQYVCGMEAQYKDDAGSIFVDHTGVNGVDLQCCDIIGLQTIEKKVWVLEGLWRGMKHCPAGEVMRGIQIRYNSATGLTTDDSAIEGLKLECGRPQSFEPLHNTPGAKPPELRSPADLHAPYPSTEYMVDPGLENGGSWTTLTACSGDALVTGFKTRNQPDSWLTDHTGTNGVSIQCSDGATYQFAGQDGTWDAGFTTCNTGTFVCGIQVFYADVQLDHGGIDGMRQVCCDLNGKTVNTRLVYIGKDNGNWRDVHMCTPGTYVHQVAVRYDTKGSLSDDLGVNGMKMWCQRTTGTDNLNPAAPGHAFPPSGPSYVTIWDSGYGTWRGYRTGCTNGYVNSFAIKDQGTQGIWKDDLATVGLKMRCTDNTEMSWVGQGGTWDTWAPCPAATYACGMAVQYESNTLDHTAINGVRTYCCDYSGKSVTSKQQNTDGNWGDWKTPVYCAPGEFIESFNPKYEDDGSGDSRGLTGLRVRCAREAAVPLPPVDPPVDPPIPVTPPGCPTCQEVCSSPSLAPLLGIPPPVEPPVPPAACAAGEQFNGTSYMEQITSDADHCEAACKLDKGCKVYEFQPDSCGMFAPGQAGKCLFFAYVYSTVKNACNCAGSMGQTAQESSCVPPYNPNCTFNWVDLKNMIHPPSVAQWSASADGKTVFQTENSVTPAYGLTPDEYDSFIYEYDVQIQDTIDDDEIGFSMGHKLPSFDSPMAWDSFQANWKKSNDYSTMLSTWRSSTAADAFNAINYAWEGWTLVRQKMACKCNPAYKDEWATNRPVGTTYTRAQACESWAEFDCGVCDDWWHAKDGDMPAFCSYTSSSANYNDKTWGWYRVYYYIWNHGYCRGRKNLADTTSSPADNCKHVVLSTTNSQYQALAGYNEADSGWEPWMTYNVRVLYSPEGIRVKVYADSGYYKDGITVIDYKFGTDPGITHQKGRAGFELFSQEDVKFWNAAIVPLDNGCIAFQDRAPHATEDSYPVLASGPTTINASEGFLLNDFDPHLNDFYPVVAGKQVTPDTSPVTVTTYLGATAKVYTNGEIIYTPNPASTGTYDYVDYYIQAGSLRSNVTRIHFNLPNDRYVATCKFIPEARTQPVTKDQLLGTMVAYDQYGQELCQPDWTMVDSNGGRFKMEFPNTVHVDNASGLVAAGDYWGTPHIYDASTNTSKDCETLLITIVENCTTGPWTMEGPCSLKPTTLNEPATIVPCSTASPTQTFWIKDFLELEPMPATCDSAMWALQRDNDMVEPLAPHLGGEAFMRPQVMETVGTYKWTPIDKLDPSLPSTCDVQYYSTAIYSPFYQSVSFTEEHSEDIKIWVDGSLVVDSPAASAAMGTPFNGPVNLDPKWHQVIIRVKGYQSPPPTFMLGITGCSSLESHHNIPESWEQAWTREITEGPADCALTREFKPCTPPPYGVFTPHDFPPPPPTLSPPLGVPVVELIPLGVPIAEEVPVRIDVPIGVPLGIPIGVPVGEPKEFQVPVEKLIPVDVPFAVPAELKVPSRLDVPIGVPIAVPREIPTPVGVPVTLEVPRGVPVGIPLAVPQGVPTDMEVPVAKSVPIGVPVGVPVELLVPSLIEVPLGVPKGVPIAVPVLNEIPIEVKIPIGVPNGVPYAHPVGAPVITQMPWPVGVPLGVPRGVPLWKDIPITKEVPVAVPKENYINTPKQLNVPVFVDVPTEIPILRKVPEVVEVPLEVPIQMPVEVPTGVPTPSAFPMWKDYPLGIPIGVPEVLHVPIEKRIPIGVPSDNLVPMAEKIPVGVPREIPVAVPTLVEVPIAQNIPIGVPKKVEVPVYVDIPVGVPIGVETPFGFPSQTPADLRPIAKEVPIAVQIPVGVPVNVPFEKLIPVGVPMRNAVPIRIEEPQGVPYTEIVDVPVLRQVPVSNLVPVGIPQAIEVPVEVPVLKKIPVGIPIGIPIGVPSDNTQEVPLAVPTWLEVPKARPVQVVVDVPKDMAQPQLVVVPIAVPQEKAVPVHVPVAVPVEIAVPQISQVPIEVPVLNEIPLNQPVRVEVPISIPIGVPIGVPSALGVPQFVYVPENVPVGVPRAKEIPISVEIPVAVIKQVPIGVQIPFSKDVPEEVPIEVKVPMFAPVGVPVDIVVPQAVEVPIGIPVGVPIGVPLGQPFVGEVPVAIGIPIGVPVAAPKAQLIPIGVPLGVPRFVDYPTANNVPTEVTIDEPIANYVPLAVNVPVAVPVVKEVPVLQDIPIGVIRTITVGVPCPSLACDSWKYPPIPLQIPAIVPSVVPGRVPGYTTIDGTPAVFRDNAPELVEGQNPALVPGSSPGMQSTTQLYYELPLFGQPASRGVPIGVPVAVPVANEVPLENKIPIAVQIPVAVPVHVPVEVKVPQAYYVIVESPVAVPVAVNVPIGIPLAVPKESAAPHGKFVPRAQYLKQDVPVGVPISRDIPVERLVPVENRVETPIEVFVPTAREVPVANDVVVDIPRAVPQWNYIDVHETRPLAVVIHEAPVWVPTPVANLVPEIHEVPVGVPKAVPITREVKVPQALVHSDVPKPPEMMVRHIPVGVPFAIEVPVAREVPVAVKVPVGFPQLPPAPAEQGLFESRTLMKVFTQVPALGQAGVDYVMINTATGQRVPYTGAISEAAITSWYNSPRSRPFPESRPIEEYQISWLNNAMWLASQGLYHKTTPTGQQVLYIAQGSTFEALFNARGAETDPSRNFAGPLTAAQVDALRANGHIDGDSLAYQNGVEQARVNMNTYPQQIVNSGYLQSTPALEGTGISRDSGSEFGIPTTAANPAGVPTGEWNRQVSTVEQPNWFPTFPYHLEGGGGRPNDNGTGGTTGGNAYGGVDGGNDTRWYIWLALAAVVTVILGIALGLIAAGYAARRAAANRDGGRQADGNYKRIDDEML